MGLSPVLGLQSPFYIFIFLCFYVPMLLCFYIAMLLRFHAPNRLGATVRCGHCAHSLEAPLSPVLGLQFPFYISIFLCFCIPMLLCFHASMLLYFRASMFPCSEQAGG